jgi:uncharacterized protein YeaO (DUF488 family)
VSEVRIVVKRIHEPPAQEDGFRVLADRLWPRGLSKAAARLDLWLPEIGPSTALRQWFKHDPERWKTFCTNYHIELCEKTDLVASLTTHAKNGPVMLLYSAREERFNRAVALQMFLKSTKKPGSPIPHRLVKTHPRSP